MGGPGQNEDLKTASAKASERPSSPARSRASKRGDGGSPLFKKSSDSAHWGQAGAFGAPAAGGGLFGGGGGMAGGATGTVQKFQATTAAAGSL